MEKRKNKKYSAEFKLRVILDMRNNNLSCSETVRKYRNTITKQETSNHRSILRLWEHIFLEEGAVEFTIERRGGKTKMDNPKKGRQERSP